MSGRCGCARRVANSASFYTLTPIHVDMLQHPHRALLSHVGIQRCAAYGEVTLLSRKHTRASCRCLLSCCFSRLWARRLQCILLTTYLTLPHLAPPKKHGKKSYSETKAQLKDCVFKAVGSWIEWIVGLVRGRELAWGGGLQLLKAVQHQHEHREGKRAPTFCRC